MCQEWTEVGLGMARGSSGLWYVTDFGVRDGGPTLVPVNLATIDSTSMIPRPTRAATRIPTNTPTITLTPSITFTPIATFTPSLTSTALPPTATGIVIAISPQPTDGPAPTQTATETATGTATASAPAAIQPDITPLAQVAMLESPVPLQKQSVSDSTSPDSGFSVRSLIPIGIALQVVIIGGLAMNAVVRRKR
jgi:hypothetical protein